MARTSAPASTASPTPHGAPRGPYLRLQHTTVFVRDIERSRRFFVDQLGFSLAIDTVIGGVLRWIAVAPPDGTATLAIVAPRPGTDEVDFIGRAQQIAFITEDVLAIYAQWKARGVRFHQPPQKPSWGGVFTSFEDPDGNSFALVGFDEVTRQLEAERNAAEEKLQAERRAARDMEIATEVQARLFPQQAPPCRTLDYAGLCLQARQVGGDYYDYLQLGPHRLGLVLGDIAGKGIAGALLMVNLQANLRSQSALALAEPRRLLCSVNQLFHDNTVPSAYATLFFAEYDDTAQQLLYANCGHLPALLLRADGTLERLEPTATVLGLFAAWDCAIEHRQLAPGDTLVLYTDGVSEACNPDGDEFGEERIAALLREHHNSSAQAIAHAISHAVQTFSPHEQQDDITLIVARCRA